MLILSQLTQKELVQARTIWKKWREVVDAHFEFTVIVHDGKTNLDRVYELRIKDCLITRLLGNKDIFQYPSLIRRIRFWGPINVTCFQGIMGQATAIEELSLTKFALMQENLVGDERLDGFAKVKKLELLGYMCKDESKVIARNSAAIFAYNMPDLEKLTINFHCDIASINLIAVSFMEFISRHSKLLNLQVSLVPEANHPNESAATRITSTLIPVPVQEMLKNVQLNMLRITTATKDLPIWTALLNSQTRLQDFRMHLSEGGLLTMHTNYTIGIPFDILREPLLRNATTLTSVELKELRLPSIQAGAPVDFMAADAGIFRYAANLKRLILHRNSDDYRRFPQYPDQPSIINLKMLPVSVEVLEISRFYCRSDELQFLVDVLENLKTIVLAHTGNLNRLGVHGGIVESISSKTEIQTMNVTPLNYYCSIENKKYDAVKAKFGMNDGDHLYYDFERYRNGLPQPRPPTVESNYVNVQRPRRDFNERRRRDDHRCNMIRYKNTLAEERIHFDRMTRKDVAYQRFDNLVYKFHRKWIALSPTGPRFRLVDQQQPLQSTSANQCPNEKQLSRLFDGLDLHMSQEQRVLCPLPRQTRRRRWSGEIIMS